MQNITDETIVKRNPEMLASEIDGEKVMMSMDKGEYFGLNTVGSRIWELIEEEIEVNDLIGKMLEEFDVESSACKEDVIGFLNELNEKGLIVIK
mgnify:FL=1